MKSIFLALILSVVSCGAALPLLPASPVSDQVGKLDPKIVSALNTELTQFEKETSNQIVVAVLPDFGNSDMETFTQQTAQSWKVGQKDKNNGAVLFWFPNQRKVRIEVGYGLEGALTDALSKRIIETNIIPSFKQGDWGAGIVSGVHSMMAASKGEYKADNTDTKVPNEIQFWLIILVIIIVLVIAIIIVSAISNDSSSGGGGYSGGGWSGGGGGSSRSSSRSSSSSSSGDSGGWSGGGGSFGGGGASGGY